MLDDLKEEEIVNKVGSALKVSTLIQKRMRALDQVAKPLVALKSSSPYSYGQFRKSSKARFSSISPGRVRGNVGHRHGQRIAAGDVGDMSD